MPFYEIRRFLSFQHSGFESKSIQISVQNPKYLQGANTKMVSFLLIYILPIGFILYGIRKLRERKWGYCQNNIRLNNKVVLITGANSGIGFELAKEMALRNGEVIMACRTLQIANNAVTQIEKQLKISVKLVPMELDLSSLKSVNLFAKRVQNCYPEIHILINNAGVAYPSKDIHFTEDNLEMHFGVNYLAHFYLTKMLIPQMKKDARIVIVSSSRHEKGTIDLNNLNQINLTKKQDLYANSKLANIYFCQELAKITKDNNINSYAVCPGWVYTRLFRHSLRWYHYILVAPIAFLFMRHPYQGAQTVIYCATEPSLQNETGLLYRDCKRYSSKYKFDSNVARRLWETSEELLKNIS